MEFVQQRKHEFVYQLDAFQQASKDADHVDIKSIDSDVNIRQFIAGMFNYHPAWLGFLYRVRMVFIRILGLKQSGVPQRPQLDADTLELGVGKRIAFFHIDDYAEDRYMFTSAEESHLKATLAIVQQPLASGLNRFHVVTLVHYNSSAGPIYFNVIRPFHHIVVKQMMKAGAQSS